MKRLLISFIICSALLFSGCGSSSSSSSAESSTITHAIDTDASSAITTQISEKLSVDATGWIATATPGIVSFVDNKTASVTVRVIVPDAIPMVSENILSVLPDIVKSNGCDSYDLTVESYSDSNAGGVDTSTTVYYETKDGKTGFFLDAPQKYSLSDATIDDLYSYYNNLGK